MNTANFLHRRTAMVLAAVLGNAWAPSRSAQAPAAAPGADASRKRSTCRCRGPASRCRWSIDILSARIEVIGEERKDVALTVTLSGGRRKIVMPSGAKTLSGGGSGLEISERDNRVSIESEGRPSPMTIVARVPRRAAAESLDDQRRRDHRARHRRRPAAGEHQRADHRDQHHRVGDRGERQHIRSPSD